MAFVPETTDVLEDSNQKTRAAFRAVRWERETCRCCFWCGYKGAFPLDVPMVPTVLMAAALGGLRHSPPLGRGQQLCLDIRVSELLKRLVVMDSGLD